MTFNKVVNALEDPGLFSQQKETDQRVRTGRGHEKGKEERE